MRPALIPLLLLMLSITGAAGAAELDPQQPSTAQRSNPVVYDVDLRIAVTAPYHTKLLRIWMPIPPSDHGQEVLSSDIETFPQQIPARIASEPMYGNRFAYFEFADPQGAQLIQHRLKIRVWELRWNMAADSVQPVATWPSSFDKWRRHESQAVATNDRLEQLLRQIVPQRQNPLTDLHRVMNWVDGNLQYDHSRASLAASSIHAFETRAGHCSDFHGFCAAMGRLMDQPTRVTYGINTFPKSSPSHCKLEAFLPPYGWVSFDVSETQKMGAAIRKKKLDAQETNLLTEALRRRLVTGFRDNTWFVQTRGTDYELAPPASSRVPVVRTIYAEADGKPLPEPDPSSDKQTQFAWMTAHRFASDREVTYPFADLTSLQEWVKSE